MSDRYGRRIIPLVGLSNYVLGALFSLDLHNPSSTMYLMVCLIVTGLGFGLVFTAPQTAALEASPPHLTGAATGVYLMGWYVGGAFGVSIVRNATAQAVAGSLMPAFHSAILILAALAVHSLALAPCCARASTYRAGTPRAPDATAPPVAPQRIIWLGCTARAAQPAGVLPFRRRATRPPATHPGASPLARGGRRKATA